MPAPLGPMIAWISPVGTVSVSPLRIGLPATVAWRFSISSILFQSSATIERRRCVRQRIVASWIDDRLAASVDACSQVAVRVRGSRPTSRIATQAAVHFDSAIDRPAEHRLPIGCAVLVSRPSRSRSIDGRQQIVIRLRCSFQLQRRAEPSRNVSGKHHPTLPSRLIPSSFCASTANSIGSCFSTSRAKPLTISATALSASSPRIWA